MTDTRKMGQEILRDFLPKFPQHTSLMKINLVFFAALLFYKLTSYFFVGWKDEE